MAHKQHRESFWNRFKRPEAEVAMRCKSCGHKLALLGGTRDCFFCPDCVIADKQEQRWRNKYGLDWFQAPSQEEVKR